jgi:ERCC4-type nuclease
VPHLIVDPRAGSKDLIPHLRALGVKCVEERMEYGDVAFVGNGPDGPMPIGLEHKSVADVLDCILSGRFAARQLPGLLDSYAQVWLVVEGAFRPGPAGELYVPRGHGGRFGPVPWGHKDWMYRHLQHWLLSIQIQGGCRVMVARDKRESAAAIKALFTWWTAKEWSEHETLHTLDHTLQRRIGYRPTYARKAAAVLPGIGWERSAAVAEKFGSIERMVLASLPEWSEIEGVGVITAKKAMNAIKGRG